MSARSALVVLSIVIVGGVFASAQSKPASKPKPSSSSKPAGPSKLAAQPALRGAWRVAEVTTSGPNASTDKQPQPGMYIFTNRHYSMMRVTGDKPRAELPTDITKATSEQLIAAWNPFVANSGTYDVAGETLTTHAMVAKSPNVMKKGSFTVSAIKYDGKTLTITAVRNQDGPVPNPVTLKLARIE